MIKLGCIVNNLSIFKHQGKAKEKKAHGKEQGPKKLFMPLLRPKSARKRSTPKRCHSNTIPNPGPVAKAIKVDIQEGEDVALHVQPTPVIEFCEPADCQVCENSALLPPPKTAQVDEREDIYKDWQPQELQSLEGEQYDRVEKGLAIKIIIAKHIY